MVVAKVNLGVCKAGNASHVRAGAASSVRLCGGQSGQSGVLGVNSRRRDGVKAEAGLGMVAAGLVEAIGHSGLVLVRHDSLSPVAPAASVFVVMAYRSLQYLAICRESSRWIGRIQTCRSVRWARCSG